jgi:peptidoglycan/LPS O-acetylase OafA/YrhL
MLKDLRKTRIRQDIQFLRGLSVIAVVLFHAFEKNFPAGFLGVDVFFVISGFVVTPLILNIFLASSESESRFRQLSYYFKNRFFRLVPALFVSIFICSVLIFFFGPTGDHQRIAKQGFSSTIGIGNFGAYKFSGDYFSPNSNPFVHTWSLGIETQIYVFLPLLFLLLNSINRKSKSLLYVSMLLISILSFLSFLYSSAFEKFYTLFDIQLASEFAFYSSINRFWEFSVGGFLYLSAERLDLNSLRLRKFFGWLSISCLMALLLFQGFIEPKVGSIAATILAAFVIKFRALDLIPSELGAVLHWLGGRSYSIYLYHLPLIYIAKYSSVPFEFREGREVLTCLSVCASLVIGSMSFSFIETPFRRGFPSFRWHFKVKAILVVSVFLFTNLSLYSLLVGSQYQYWGLERDAPPPPYAGALDPKCERDSLSGPPCSYNIQGTQKSVLLIGDSHAGQYSQALLDVAHKVGWNATVWAHGGCLIQFTKSKNRDSQICVDNNIKMLDWVRTNRPNAVIISNYVRTDDNLKSLVDALDELRSLNSNVLLLETNPIFPDKDLFFASRPLATQVFFDVVYAKEFPVEEMNYSDTLISDKYAAQARNLGISTFNPWPLFCNESRCKRFEKGRWLYEDDDHLSVYGAAKVMPFLEEFLRTVNHTS